MRKRRGGKHTAPEFDYFSFSLSSVSDLMSLTGAEGFRTPPKLRKEGYIKFKVHSGGLGGDFKIYLYNRKGEHIEVFVDENYRDDIIDVVLYYQKGALTQGGAQSLAAVIVKEIKNIDDSRSNEVIEEIVEEEPAESQEGQEQGSSNLPEDEFEDKEVDELEPEQEQGGSTQEDSSTTEDNNMDDDNIDDFEVVEETEVEEELKEEKGEERGEDEKEDNNINDKESSPQEGDGCCNNSCDGQPSPSDSSTSENENESEQQGSSSDSNTSDACSNDCDASDTDTQQGGSVSHNDSSNQSEGGDVKNINYEEPSSDINPSTDEEILESLDEETLKSFRDLFEEAGVDADNLLPAEEEVEGRKDYNDIYQMSWEEETVKRIMNIKIKRSLIRRLKRVFDRLLGSELTGDQESPRLDPKKLVIQLQKYSLNRIYKEELDKSYVMVAVDMSGSIHGFESLAKFAFDLASKNHNVIVVIHNNMYPMCVVEEGRGRIFTRDDLKNKDIIEFYKSLVKDRDVKYLLNVNDLDGLNVSEALYKELSETRVLHLDNYGCSYKEPELSTQYFRDLKNVKYYIGIGSPEDICEVVESELI